MDRNRLRPSRHQEAGPQGCAGDEAAPSATVAGVFTLNRFCAAPVQVSKANLAAVTAGGAPIRALVVNTGNANAGTGETGLARARATCAALARPARLRAANRSCRFPPA